MDAQQHLQIKKYANLFYRWKAFIYICFLLSLSAGIGFYLVTPKVYRATALLIYEKQKVVRSKMSQDTEPVAKDTISTLTQQVTSRTTLEELIKSFDLYGEMRARLPLEDVIETMRKHIKVDPTKGDIFQVSFEGGDPRKVLKVTNAIASKFIEENLKFREERATQTSEYIQKELDIAKKSIDEKESVMRDYKLKYYNEMPQQRDANMLRINALQLQMQSKQDSIQNLERTKLLVMDQVAGLKRSFGEADEAGNPGGAEAQQAVSDIDDPAARLDKVRAYHDSLLLRYTPAHPEVQRIRRLLDTLEKEVASQPKAQTSAGSNEKPPLATTKIPRVSGKQESQLSVQMQNIDRNIEGLRSEQEELRQQLAKYQAWILTTPVREAEWSALTRDYDELKRHYDYLVAQNLQADSATHLEKQQKGSQFKIVDPARLPETPSWPNIYRILGMALAGGLGFAFCCIFLVNFFDLSFREVYDLEDFLGLPVSCTIPYIETNREKRWRQVKIGLWLTLVLLTLCLLGLTFWYLIRRGLIIF
ncbi:MAG: hypothetical protein BWK76_13595 [Desulfobulbaceae bacterium A2]|nr:MAG: hypothetical protein BWK76_13595 [Desulfobulbaceae bacterium A2]